MWHSMKIEFSNMNGCESLICSYFGDGTGALFSFSSSVSWCGSPHHFSTTSVIKLWGLSLHPKLGLATHPQKNNLKSQKLQRDLFNVAHIEKRDKGFSKSLKSVTGVLKWDQSLNYGPEICIHISCPGKGVVLPATDPHCLGFIFIL